MNTMTERRPSTRAAFATDDAKWDAVVRRDVAADDQFYCAVRTTGVFCRPSCSARRPKRENVGYFATAAAAVGAGFRPCKRCRPDAAPLVNQHAAKIAATCRLMDDATVIPNLGALAAAAGMSRYHYHRTFKSITGMTPRQYASAARAHRLREALPRSASVTEAIYATGFNSNSRFYAGASAALGMKPSAFRAGGAGNPIRFAIGECSLGPILVAASSQGVCAILLGDEPDLLAREVQRRFPNAELIGDDPVFDEWVAQVIGFVEAPRLGLDLPLDVRGSAFQRRVWQALRDIPLGSTANYAEVARRIGQPNAARAVATACAANVLAVAIPCHRVIRSDGSLSGYRWGVERKRALLERESNEGVFRVSE